MGRVGREGQRDHRAGVHECGVEKLHLTVLRGSGWRVKACIMQYSEWLGMGSAFRCTDKKVGGKRVLQRSGQGLGTLALLGP